MSTPTGQIPIPDPVIGALSPATAVVNAIPGAAQLIPGLEPIADAIGTALDPNVWKRIGVMALGVFLCYVGVIMWVASSDTAQGLAGAALGAAVPGGAAVKAAGAAASKIGD